MKRRTTLYIEMPDENVIEVVDGITYTVENYYHTLDGERMRRYEQIMSILTIEHNGVAKMFFCKEILAEKKDNAIFIRPIYIHCRYQLKGHVNMLEYNTIEDTFP